MKFSGFSGIGKKTVSAASLICATLGLTLGVCLLTLSETESETLALDSAGDTLQLSQAQAEKAELASTPAPSASPAPSTAPSAATAASSPGAPEKSEADEESCLSDETIIADLKLRRDELEKRMTEVSAKEAELKARERALEEEIKKLSQLRQEISKISGNQKKANDEKIARVVEMVEAMNPKSSAQLLATLDESLAVSAMSRMTTAKVSKVLNVMDVKKSSRLTELLAGLQPAEVSKGYSEKGGDKNDGNVKTNQSTNQSNESRDQQRESRKPTASGGAAASGGTGQR